MNLKQVNKNVRFNLGTSIGNHPMTFPLFYWSKSRQNGIIRKDSDICIEGFQRCGNTFFHFAFKKWNKQSKIAHHLHASAQVIKATQLEIPTIVLIREPLETIASLLIKDLDLKIETGLKKYIQFYNNLSKHKTKFIVGPFDQVVDQPGELVIKINQKFGTDFKYEILNENKKNNYKIQIQRANAKNELTAQWQRSSVPSEEKERAKQAIKGDIINHELFRYASRVYSGFIL